MRLSNSRTGKSYNRKTDWRNYYANPFPLAFVTRRILGRHISRNLHQFLSSKKDLAIAEFGGANSSVYPILNSEFRPAVYHIIDKHPTQNARLGDKTLCFHEKDILDFEHLPLVDVTLSTGLIEHFCPENTKKAVQAHMKILKPGGLSVMTFPTPTWLYKTTRRLSELFGSWIFVDERPLTMEEVKQAASEHGTVLSCKILWATVFTQALFVVQKFPAGKTSPNSSSLISSASIK